MRAVVLTTALPGAGRSGGELVTKAMAEALRGAGWDVAVVGFARPGVPPASGEVAAGERPIETSAAGRRAALWMARALATRAPYSVAKYSSRAYVEAARRELGRGASLVIADHAQVAFAVRALRPLPAPLVFVAHNVEADAYRATTADSGGARRILHRREARLIGRRERELAEAARQVWALTGDDARAFGPAAHALAVPSHLEPADQPDEPARDIALIGNWGWGPNAIGLRWFAEEVVTRLPDGAAVEVAGAGADWLAGRDPRVAVRGVVPDAAEFLAGARVAAVPATAGSGVQIKTLDAIACGIPAVVTPTAARGLPPLPASVTVAADAPSFAAALGRRLVHGERERLRAEARAWSRERASAFAAQVAELAAAAAR